MSNAQGPAAPGNIAAGCLWGFGPLIVLILSLTVGGGLLTCALMAELCAAALPGPDVGDPGGGGQQGGGGNTITYRGSDSSGDLPLVSIRDFTGGEAPITTTGTFTLSQTLPMHPPATFADGTSTDLVYGDMLANEYIDMGFSNLAGSEGLGLNVYSGDWQAVYQGQGCSWVVQVAPTSVSGHISCTDIPAYNDADGTTGSIDLEMDFTADSTAGAESPPPGGG